MPLLLLRRSCARSVRWASHLAPRCASLRLLTEQDRKALGAIVGHEGVVDEPAELDVYNADWLGKYKGRSTLALKPRDVTQVSRVLAYCNQHRIGVVPQGGNTGLVGGSVPVHDEVILLMSRMNRILSIDASAGTLVVEAGCVLEVADNELSKHGLIMPLDLGAKGSCQIGGNISTNAGGLRFLRYGSLRGSVLGLEMVLPDGTIVDNLSTLRKDNTGYDVKQLFIGGEGTLGVVTKVSMAVPQRPTSVQLAFVAVNNYDSVLNVMKRARSQLGEILSALEFLDSESLEIVLGHVNARDPLSSKFPFYMVIETSGNCEEADSKRLNEFLMGAMEDGAISDGTVAQDSEQMKELWALREGISPSMSSVGCVYKYDVSVPVESMYRLVETMKERLKGVVDAKFITGYGHLVDANLHLNIAAPSYNDKIRDRIEPYVYEVTSELRGSISAEHGLGVMKGSHMHYSKSPEMIAVFRNIKRLFDPNGIMNPYKFLPSADGAHTTMPTDQRASGATA